MSDTRDQAKKLADEVKVLADTQVGREIVGKVSNMAHEKLAEVKKAANNKGLGGLLDNVINVAEKNVGIDLDGDGDMGK